MFLYKESVQNLIQFLMSYFHFNIYFLFILCAKYTFFLITYMYRGQYEKSPKLFCYIADNIY